MTEVKKVTKGEKEPLYVIERKERDDYRLEVGLGTEKTLTNGGKVLIKPMRGGDYLAAKYHWYRTNEKHAFPIQEVPYDYNAYQFTIADVGFYVVCEVIPEGFPNQRGSSLVRLGPIQLNQQFQDEVERALGEGVWSARVNYSVNAKESQEKFEGELTVDYERLKLQQKRGRTEKENVLVGDHSSNIDLPLKTSQLLVKLEKSQGDTLTIDHFDNIPVPSSSADRQANDESMLCSMPVRLDVANDYRLKVTFQNAFSRDLFFVVQKCFTALTDSCLHSLITTFITTGGHSHWNEIVRTLIEAANTKMTNSLLVSKFLDAKRHKDTYKKQVTELEGQIRDTVESYQKAFGNVPRIQEQEVARLQQGSSTFGALNPELRSTLGTVKEKLIRHKQLNEALLKELVLVRKEAFAREKEVRVQQSIITQLKEREKVVQKEEVPQDEVKLSDLKGLLQTALEKLEAGKTNESRSELQRSGVDDKLVRELLNTSLDEYAEKLGSRPKLRESWQWLIEPLSDIVLNLIAKSLPSQTLPVGNVLDLSQLPPPKVEHLAGEQPAPRDEAIEQEERRQFVRLAEENEELRKTKEALFVQLTMISTEKNDLLAQIRVLEHENSTLRASSEAKAGEEQNFQAKFLEEIKQLKERNAGLQGQIEELIGRLERQTLATNNAEEQVKQLVAKHEELTSELERLREEKKSRESDLEELGKSTGEKAIEPLDSQQNEIQPVNIQQLLPVSQEQVLEPSPENAPLPEKDIPPAEQPALLSEEKPALDEQVIAPQEEVTSPTGNIAPVEEPAPAVEEEEEKKDEGPQVKKKKSRGKKNKQKN